MSLKEVIATILCDGCGAGFNLKLDTAASKSKRIGKWSLFELVEDSLLEGLNFVGFVDKKKKPEPQAITGILLGDHLCPDCVKLLGPQEVWTREALDKALEELEIGKE